LQEVDGFLNTMTTAPSDSG